MRRKQGRNLGLGHVFDALRFSMAGLRYGWRQEFAFRLEVTLGLAVVPCAFWLGADAGQQMLLLLSYGLVLICEIFNSALEAAVDRIGLEEHELSGAAKDLGSAAVLISMLTAALVWGAAAWGPVTAFFN